MALGNALPGFNDWYTSTGPALYSGPEEILNELTKINYSLSYFMEGDMKKMLQGGTKITDSIYLTGDFDFGTYFPGQVETFNATNTLTMHESPWRFERGKMSWTEAEVDLQGSSQFSDTSRFQTFKRIKEQKRENLMTGVSNGIETRIWAQPNATLMESATATADAMHYSVPCFVNEFSAAQSGSAAGLFPGFTTLQQLSPTTYPNWDNQRYGYTSAGKVKSTHDSSPNDLNRSLARARRKTKASPLPRGGGKNQAFDAPSFIACSDYGIWLYEQNLEAGNERYRTMGRNDGDYGGVNFDGIPLTYIEALDNAALYPDGNTPVTTLKTEAAADIVGPRYYLINKPFLKMFFHVDHFFNMKAPYFLPQQPDVWVSLLDLWSNFFCRSRRRHAIVHPTVDQTAQTG